MTHQVYMLEPAEQDIKDIYYYVAVHDSQASALRLIDELETACFKLENFPQRGMVPHELMEIGIVDYLQILCFSYRIIFQIENNKVFIHAVLDGRRDISALLERRFLRISI
jgi:toxin ParE1/3/4